MKYSVPNRLIDTVCRHLLDAYLPSSKKRFKHGSAFNKADLEFFTKGAGALSEAFTTGRGRLPKNYLNLKEFRTGYILYFTVTNYLKSLFCLNEAGLTKRTGVRVLDIGTGPGTSLIAATDHFKEARLFGIDQNAHILRDAASIIKAYSGIAPSIKPAMVTAKNLGSLLGRERFDVIFLSNIIGEFRNGEEAEALICAAAEHHLEKGGALIVIEPALQKTTRNMMEVRDLVCDRLRAGMQVLSPCLHSGPCPMLKANRRDWCHMYLEWERPAMIEAVDRLIGNRKDFLKFSYLVIGAMRARTANDHIYRVVSLPLMSNGKVELLICNGNGLQRLTRLDRDRSVANSGFDWIKRGDVIEYAGPMRMTTASSLRIWIASLRSQ